MNKAVAERAEPQAVDVLRPDPLVQATVDQLVMFWPNDGTPVVIRRDMTSNERSRLQLRNRDIHGALRPMGLEDKKKAVQALAVMFAGMPSMRNADSESTIAAFVYALADMPLFAVLAACDDVMKNRVAELDPDYPVNAARMVNLAKRHTAPLHGETVMLEKTLKAKQETILSPEERERVGKGMRAMADGLKADREKERQARMKEISDAARATETTNLILRDYRRLGLEPQYADKEKTILLTPDLARK